MLISGALEDGAYGAHPARGVLFGALTGIAYAGFILILRHGNEDLRRPAGPLFDATWVAAVGSLAVALALGVDDLAPAWPSAGWLMLLALSSQVLGWLLISISLPRLPAALTSMILTIQPVGSVVLGIVLLGEDPSALQLCGAACILAGLVSVAAAPPRSGPGVVGRGSGGEPLGAPAVALARVQDALVQPVRAALPELDRVGPQQVAAPVGRPRDLARIARAELDHALLERLVVRQHAALGAMPRRSAGCRTARLAK